MKSQRISVNFQETEDNNFLHIMIYTLRTDTDEQSSEILYMNAE